MDGLKSPIRVLRYHLTSFAYECFSLRTHFIYRILYGARIFRETILGFELLTC